MPSFYFRLPKYPRVKAEYFPFNITSSNIEYSYSYQSDQGQLIKPIRLLWFFKRFMSYFCFKMEKSLKTEKISYIGTSLKIRFQTSKPINESEISPFVRVIVFVGRFEKKRVPGVHKKLNAPDMQNLVSGVLGI